jgi:predicted dehydrogenase
MNKIRFGITGSGYMGRTHAEAIRRLDQTAELVAVWGGSRAPGLAARYGIACETSMEALMARPDIDAVVITTPHAMHVAEGMLALKSGKHIMLEKPMATTLEDCDRMIAEAARRRLVIGTAYILRFRNNPIRVRELIARNAIGRLLTVQISQLYNLGTQLGSYQWLSDPANIGNLIDGFPHTIDILRWFTGAEVKTVSAFSRTFMAGRPKLEDTTVATLEFSNGMICTASSSCALSVSYPDQHAHLRIVGSAGNIDLDSFGDVFIGDEAGWRLETKQPPIGYDDPEAAFKDPRIKTFCNQMQSFIDGIQGKPMTAGNGLDGRAGVEVSLAMLESSRERRWIDLPRA